MLHFYSILFSVLLASSCSAQTVSTVYQFPGTPFTVVENLAVRSNGNLLLNTITSATTYILDPTSASPTPTLVYSFPGTSSMIGIAEVYPDVFAVATGNYTPATKQGVPGSFSIWKIDYSSGGSTPVVSLVTAIPGAWALNGMTAISNSPGMILVADSALGAVWSVNIDTGAYQVAIEDPLLNNTATFPLGINGLHMVNYGGYRTLYFTNSAQGFFGSIPINSQGQATGTISILTNPLSGLDFPGYPSYIYDDFALDGFGRAWVANHPNAVIRINPVFGSQKLIANGTSFVQPTSAAFGRSSLSELCTLYVTCAGSYPTSGSVQKIDVC